MPVTPVVLDRRSLSARTTSAADRHVIGVDFPLDANLDDRARVDAIAALLAVGVLRLIGRVDTPPSHPDSHVVGLEGSGPARPDGTDWLAPREPENP